MMERGAAILPMETAAYGTNMKISPYVLSGLHDSVDEPRAVDLRLKTFWTGWSNPLPPYDCKEDRMLSLLYYIAWFFDLGRFFFQAEDGIRDTSVTGVQTCALPI